MTRKRFTIGLLSDYLFEEYDNQIWKGVVQGASLHDLNLLCFVGGSIRDPEDYHSCSNQIYNMITPRSIDGLILVSGSLGHFMGSEEFQNWVERFRPIPLVSVGTPLEGYSSVLVDSGRGMYDLVSHYITVHQARRIAFIQGLEENLDARIRFEAYKKALDDHRLAFDPSLVYSGSFERFSGKEAVDHLINVRKVKFDTLISANDYMAVYAIRELQAQGIRVPEDVKVGGFDNCKESLGVLPALTTVEQPLFDLGFQAVELLVSNMENENFKENIKLPTKMTIRETCGCLMASWKDSKANIINIPEMPLATNALEMTNPFFKSLVTVLENGFMKIRKRIHDAHWADDLVRAFLQTFQGEEGQEFYFTLRRLVKESLIEDVEVEYWYDIIDFLIDNVKLQVDEEKLRKELERHRKKSYALVANSLDHIKQYLRVYSEEQAIILHKIGQELIMVSEEDQLKKIIKEELPKLGIRNFYFCLYDREGQDLESSHLFTFFSREDYLDTFVPGTKFPSRYILPGRVKSGKERYTFMVMPMHYRDEQLGYFLCDTGVKEGPIYQTLTNQIGTAFKAQELFEQIRKQNTLLEQKVRQRTQEIAEAHEQKERFFINLAHETKTPLTLISNYLIKYLDNPVDIRDIRVVKQNVDLLLRNMINFLDAEKLKRGQIFYNHDQMITFSDFLVNKVQLFSRIAEKKAISLFTEIEKYIDLHIDPYAIDRVVNNLLDNSVKYTPEGGKIFVSLESREESILFSVKDTGAGISEEQMESIFKPYYQMSHKKRNIQGIGMGLYIVKKILDSIEAEIKVENQESGGTAFTVIFKKNYASGDQGQDVSVSVPIDYSPEIDDLSEVEIEPGKPNVLVVDDNIEMLYFLQSFLKDQFNVFLAVNGKRALMKMKEIQKPDVIISDIMMDEMDGYDLFQNLAEDEEFEDIPLIFLTAKSSLSDKLKGLTSGAIDYIYKPFNIEEVVAKINAIIKNRRIVDANNLKKIKNKIINIFQDAAPFSVAEDPEKITEENFGKICLKYNITLREREIVHLTLQGFLNKEISLKLNISTRTVEFHLHNIYKKCNIKNRVELFNIFQS